MRTAPRIGSFTLTSRTAACAAAVLTAGLVLAAAPSRAETLTEALVDVYATNPTLQSERASLRAVDEGVAQAVSNWRPTVVVNGSYGYQDITRTTDGNPTSTNFANPPRSADITLSQNVFRGFRTLAETRQARNQVAASRARLVSTEQDVLFAGVTAFADVLRDQATVELNRNNVLVLTRQLEATQDRFRVGELTRTDVAQAEARLQRAVSELVFAQGSLTESIAAFINVVGRPPGDLEIPPIPEDLPASEEETIDGARANDPDVLAAEFDERASINSVDLVRGELLPTLTVNGAAEYSEDVSDRVKITSQSVTANLSVPLYQSGDVYSRVREAKQRASETRSDLFETQRASIEDATDAWESLQTARSQILAFESEVRAQEIALEGVRQEARVGARTTLDVLDAEQELLDSRVNLVSARRDEIVASHEVLGAIGRLTARDLALPVDLYDFTVNYGEVADKLIGTGIIDE